MGEARRRQHLDPTYGRVSQALRQLVASSREVYYKKYQEIGRNTAVIDELGDSIPFIRLDTLQDPTAEQVPLLQCMGDRLIQVLQTYDPEQEAILLQVWDTVAETGLVGAKMRLQLRRLAFDGSVLISQPPKSPQRSARSVEVAKAMSLAFSEPISPVLEIEVPQSILSPNPQPKPGRRLVS